MRPMGIRAFARCMASASDIPCAFASAVRPSCSLSVNVSPGLTAFTRTPLAAYAEAMPALANIKAAFAAPPGIWMGLAIFPPAPMTFTMAPEPRWPMRLIVGSVMWI